MEHAPIKGTIPAAGGVWLQWDCGHVDEDAPKYCVTLSTNHLRMCIDNGEPIVMDPQAICDDCGKPLTLPHELYMHEVFELCSCPWWRPAGNHKWWEDKRRAAKFLAIKDQADAAKRDGST